MYSKVLLFGIVAILGKSQKKTYGLTPTFAVIYKHMRCISFLRVLPGKLFQGVDDFFRQIIRFVHTHIVNPSSRTARASKPPRGYSDAFLERTTESSQVRKKNGRLFSKTPLVSRKSHQTLKSVITHYRIPPIPPFLLGLRSIRFNFVQMRSTKNRA